MSNIEVAELELVHDWEVAVSKTRGYTHRSLVDSLINQFQNNLINRLSETDRHLESIRKCHLYLGWNFSCLGISRPKVADIGGGMGICLIGLSPPIH